MLAAGVRKKNSVAPEQKGGRQLATPTVTEAAKTDVVEMQTSTDDTANIKNVMGTKSETTTSIVFTNKMSSARFLQFMSVLPEMMAMTVMRPGEVIL